MLYFIIKWSILDTYIFFLFNYLIPFHLQKLVLLKFV